MTPVVGERDDDDEHRHSTSGPKLTFGHHQKSSTKPKSSTLHSFLSKFLPHVLPLPCHPPHPTMGHHLRSSPNPCASCSCRCRRCDSPSTSTDSPLCIGAHPAIAPCASSDPPDWQVGKEGLHHLPPWNRIELEGSIACSGQERLRDTPVPAGSRQVSG